MDTWNRRLESAIAEAGSTQQAVAKAAKVAPASVSDWINGDTKDLKASKAIAICKLLNINLEWLLEGKGARSASGSLELGRASAISTWGDDTPIEDDEIAAPFYTEAQLAAGNGHVSEDGKVRTLRFSRETLRREGIEPENVVAIKVRGNSMEPDIPDGATVAIDTGDTAVRDGKEYAVVNGELARIKRVYRLPDGGMRLRSTNHGEYPDEIYTAHEAADIRIVGRVFWSASIRR